MPFGSGEYSFTCKEWLRSELAIDGLPPLAFVDRECLLDRGPGVVIDATSTVIEGLTPGVTVYVRARANGAAGSSDWSNVVSRMVI